MGVAPADAGRLSLWEYTALLSEWNAAHSDDRDEVEPPSPDFIRERRAQLERSGFGRVH